MEENWKPIPGFEDYAASDLGNFKRITPGQGTRVGKPRTQYVNPVTGYLNVTVRSRTLQQPRTQSAHKLIAKTWIPNPNNWTQVKHKNGIKTDNRVDNLEWVERVLTSYDSHIRTTCQETGEVNFYRTILQFCADEDITSHSHVYVQLNRNQIFKHPYRDQSWKIERLPGRLEF